MARVLLISFDAVGDAEFDVLMRYPHFAAFVQSCAVARRAQSVFLSNTYPVHTSVVTGMAPRGHGLINNTDQFPRGRAQWWYDAKRIGARTLWQVAHEAGLRTAAVMWPVTGGAKEIKYHIPEIMTQPGESQLVMNLKMGSKWAQLKAFLRHRKLLDGVAQPARDRFATACMVDFLRKKPDLALMHLTAYDTLCHLHGRGAPELSHAFEALDENLGALLEAVGEDTAVVLFSDHAQLPAAEYFLPNDILVDMGLMERGEHGEYMAGGAFIECCGGSAFLHACGLLDLWDVEELRERIRAHEGFMRFLSEEEMAECGRMELTFGFAVRPGWQCAAEHGSELANHGYPLDYKDYEVFYMARGEEFAPGRQLAGGSLLDIAPIVARVLGVDMPGICPVREELFV